jgi:hypothetical protein
MPIRAGVVYVIRARTRAQIESTQIVRPRPHRTRGGPVEGARGTGDLVGLAIAPGARDSVICMARWHYRVTRHVGWAIAEPSAGMLAAPLTVEVNEYSAGLVGQLDAPVGDG